MWKYLLLLSGLSLFAQPTTGGGGRGGGSAGGSFTFNPNQFTITSVTNVSIKNGVLITNIVANTITAAVTDKGGQVFNVVSYGADITGVADSLTAFQTANNVANASGGGIIYAPQGTFLLSGGLILLTDVSLQGAGIGATIIKRSSSFTNFFLSTGPNGAVRDLTIDGNATSITTAELTAQGNNSIIERVEIINPGNIGISVADVSGVKISHCVLTGNGSADNGEAAYAIWAASAGVIGLEVSHCTITDWTVAAIYMGGPGTRFTYNYVSGNHIQTSPVGGGQIATGAAGSFVVTGNYIGPSGGALGSGLELEFSNWTVTDNVIEGQARYGIVLQGGTNHVVSGNRVFNCGLSGIVINANIGGFIITGNRCYDTQGTKTQDYGIEVQAGTSDNYIISNNDLRDNLTGGLLDSALGANRIVNGNLPTSYTAFFGNNVSLASSGLLNSLYLSATIYIGIANNAYLQSSGAGELEIRDSTLSAQAAVRFNIPQITITTNYTIIAGDSGRQFNNIGASVTNRLDLPTAVAKMRYMGYVDAAFRMQFQATGGDVIRDGASVSGANAGIYADAVGSCIELFCPKSGLWVVRSKNGAWTIE